MNNRFFNIFLLNIICVMPLLVSPWSYDYYYGIKIIFVTISCVLLLIYYFVNRNNFHFDNNIELIIVLLYIILIIISTLFSVDINRSLLGAPYRDEGLYALLCYLIIFIFTSKLYIFKKKHIYYLMIPALIISIYGIAQYFGFSPFKGDVFRYNWYGQSFSTIGNRNFLGSYLTLVLPIFMFFYLKEKDLIFLISSAILFICLLCTLTRSAYVAFFIYSLIFIIFTFKKKFKIKSLVILYTIFLISAISLNSMGNSNLFNRILSIKNESVEILINTGNDIDKFGSDRIYIWKGAIKLIPDHPFFGSGPDTFDLVFMPRFKDNMHNSIYDKAHNEYLQTAVTMGIPSLIAYLLLLFTILNKSVKALKKNIFILPIFCSIIGYVVQAFFNISVVSVAPVYWAFLGMLLNLTYKVLENKEIYIGENDSGGDGI